MAALAAWMEARGLATGGELEAVGLLGGGTQNVLLHLRSGGRDLVLRRGPRHLRPTSNDNLRRELRLLRADGKTHVPHARLGADCPDAKRQEELPVGKECVSTYITRGPP